MNIRELFKKDLPEVLQGYEKRIQQEEMAEAVYAALSDGEHLIVEAGTGVGKSLAYLIPAVLWSLENDERVIVATCTKNLQDQLLNKDIPVVRELLYRREVAFSAATLKGRSNYVCLRRLETMKGSLEGNQQSFLDEKGEEERLELQSLLRELEGKHDGQKDNFNTPVFKIWTQICGENDSCLKGRCPWKNKCYINRARQAANRANIIVVNHALFFSDLLLRREGGNAVLPAYGCVILDEAHHVEEMACNNMAITVDYSRVKNFLLSLSSGGGEVPTMLRSDPVYYERFRELNSKAEKALNYVFDDARSFLGEDDIKRYREPFSKKNDILTVIEEAVNIISDSNFGSSLNLTDEGHAELETYVSRGMALLEELRFVLKAEYGDSYVYWIETSKGNENCVLKAAPIEVNNILNEYLFSKVPVVLTSATLSIGGQFSYIAERIGLSRYRSLLLDSPFNYRENCLLYVPLQALSPKEEGYYQYVADIAKSILEITSGNAFILFTSYKAMNFCFELLEEWLNEKQYKYLLQMPGETAASLLEDFKSAKNPVLFGTSSFWEGVDVPGEKLSCVIVTKLPFSVPSMPLEEARVELLRKAGINDFLQYSVPKACLKLKQGFGRLIRKSNDRGVVAVLDPRIITKSYGRYFLDSLPKTARNRSIKALERLFAS